MEWVVFAVFAVTAQVASVGQASTHRSQWMQRRKLIS